MKRRLPYIIIFLVLLGIEVFIALAFSGGFVRSYLGDVIVVWLVYCLVQAISGGRNSHSITAAGVMLFAFLVELLQAMNIVELIGLGDIAFFRTLIGTSFSWLDMLCYTAGTAVTLAGIYIYRKMNKTGKNE